jgi:hypothetical protein
MNNSSLEGKSVKFTTKKGVDKTERIGVVQSKIDMRDKATSDAVITGYLIVEEVTGNIYRVPNWALLSVV